MAEEHSGEGGEAVGQDVIDTLDKTRPGDTTISGVMS